MGYLHYNFEEVFSTIKDEVAVLAKTTVKDYANEAESDGENILSRIKSNLESWTIQYTVGEITKQDLADLIAGEKEVMQMASLADIGIAQARMDDFKNGIIDIVANTFFSII